MNLDQSDKETLIFRLAMIRQGRDILGVGDSLVYCPLEFESGCHNTDLT